MGFQIFDNPNANIIGGRKPFFSKTYTTTANIAASSTSQEVFISESDEYANSPFDTIIICNLDVVDLAIRLDRNPNNLIPVKVGATVGMDNQEFRNFTIENLSTAAAHTAGKLKITVQNTKRLRKI